MLNYAWSQVVSERQHHLNNQLNQIRKDQTFVHSFLIILQGPKTDRENRELHSSKKKNMSGLLFVGLCVI